MPWRRALLAKMQIVAGTHEIYPRQRLLVECMAAAAEDFERVECEIRCLWKFIVIYNTLSNFRFYYPRSVEIRKWESIFDGSVVNVQITHHEQTAGMKSEAKKKNETHLVLWISVSVWFVFSRSEKVEKLWNQTQSEVRRFTRTNVNNIDKEL